MMQIMASWEDTIEYKAPQNLSFTPFLSVIIAARNEEQNIINCLESIHRGSYPIAKYEIIVIDDHSDDKTALLIKSLDIPNLKYLRQEQGVHGKKKALELGISRAQGDWIVTTDADCILGPQWLMTIASYQQYHDVVFIASPVRYETGASLVSMFQSIDIMGTMAITLNGIKKHKYHMANGANMSFSKAAFDEVGGFEGSHAIASGDDMFLIQKMAKNYPDKIKFLKSKTAIATTQAEATWDGFFRQRIRWASKSSAYQEIGMKRLLVLVFLFCMTLVVNALLIPFFSSFTLFILLTQLLCKWSIDYLFLKKISYFFKKSGNSKTVDLFGRFFTLAAIHIVHIVASGFYGLFRLKTTWKGRRV